MNKRHVNNNTYRTVNSDKNVIGGIKNKSDFFNTQNIQKGNSQKFHNLGNCFWFVIITMTTVGYGDVFPESTLERVVGCAIAISGNVVVALIVSFFQDKTNLQDEEKNALDFIQRVNEKEEVMKASAAYFKANMLYMIAG